MKTFLIRCCLTSCFVMSVVILSAQQTYSLIEFTYRDTIPMNKALIYGNFIQRLGFSSGGFAQDIKLLRHETNDILVMRVKNAYKSEKENTLFYRIRPGTYSIISYKWARSEPFGVTMYTEPIYKGISSNGLEKKIESGEVSLESLSRFTFTVTAGQLFYLGTWHFDNEMVSFSDDKAVLDIILKKKFKNVDFIKAKSQLPN